MSFRSSMRGFSVPSFAQKGPSGLPHLFNPNSIQLFEKFNAISGRIRMFILFMRLLQCFQKSQPLRHVFDSVNRSKDPGVVLGIAQPGQERSGRFGSPLDLAFSRRRPEFYLIGPGGLAVGRQECERFIPTPPKAGDGQSQAICDKNRPFQKQQFVLSMMSHPFQRMKELFPIDSLTHFHCELATPSCKEDIELLPFPNGSKSALITRADSCPPGGCPPKRYWTRTDPELPAPAGPERRAEWESRFSAKGFKRGIPLQTSHDCGAHHVWFLLLGCGQESDSARGITTPRLFFLILSPKLEITR